MLCIEDAASELCGGRWSGPTQRGRSAKQMQPAYYQDKRVDEKLPPPSGDEKW